MSDKPIEGQWLPPEKPKPKQQNELEINKMLAAWKPRRVIDVEVEEELKSIE